ncbi:hypothetical protein ZHAS_00010648 [Anopheles sinensis]|uniref:Uncharacterized protein n=1 Tax=Anopheles sinensis TaxID=74873 RepID=A0A084VXZ2_ANOSI|nr:hypothetical protein ZHAS_00010648 [Anopheles sinensis]
MGKAARRSVASDPSSPTLSYHYQQQQQQHHQQRQVHQPEHLYYSSSLSYSPFNPSSPSSLASSFAASSTDSDPFGSTGTSVFTSTPAGPQLQAPRTATLQSAPPAFISSLAPGGVGGGGVGGQESPEPGPGASDLFIHSSTAATPSHSNITPEFSNRTQVDRERERLRMEFYATYDVMTGVRIAATLGGFFGLMVFLVIYKSRTRSTAKALKDPTIAAVAAAVIQEEEERELQEAIEATAFSLLQEELNINYPGLQRDRLLSLGNVSAPPMLSRGRRMSSISGGYSSLLNPSRRFSYSSTRGHRNSVSVSSRVLSAYNMGGSFGQDDYVMESDGEEADDEFDQFTTTAEIGYPSNYLSVPNKCNESRRSSAMTCCSTESSFLERRCSAITLGLSSLPPISRSPSRQQSRDDTADWEPFYPGINIIEATPKSSPCPSERVAHRSTGGDSERPSTSRSRGSGLQPSTSTGGPRLVTSLYDDSSIDCISEYPVGIGCTVDDGFGYRQRQPSSSGRAYGNGHRLDDVSIANGSSVHHPTGGHPSNQRNTSSNTSANVNASGSGGAVRRAPLASLSSFKMSSADCQDTEPKSCGSDSVFGDDSGADTDEDLQQFSTDSDELSLTMPYEEEDEQQVASAGVQRSSRGALYRRQSTLAQCDDEEADGGILLPRDAPSGTRFELEHELDSSRQHQHQHQQPTTDTSYLSSLSISHRSGAKGASDSRERPGVGNRIETKAIIERQQPNDSTNTSSSVHSQQRQSPLGAIPKVPLADCDRTRARSSMSVGLPTITVRLPDDDGDGNSDKRAPKKTNTRRSTGSSKDGHRGGPSEPSSTRQQCVEVNVIIKNSASTSNNNNNNNATTNIKSPSVILELPILAIDDDDDNEPSSSAPALSNNDPCIPGPSRKWSKETLF